MKTWLTRRMIGFYISAIILLARPEIAVQVTVLYGLLIGVAVTDALKGTKHE